MELAIKILADFYARHGYLEHMADPTAIIQDRCYQVLCRIKGILEDETLEDPQCFLKIEEIVCALEEIGSDAGLRHDFG